MMVAVALMVCLACLCGQAEGETEDPDLALQMAVVLDDSGHRLDLVEQIIQAGIEVTLSILPRMENSLRTDQLARQAGLEVMLHLPMEPLDAKWILDRQCSVFTGMDGFDVACSLCEAFRWVPDAKGINNHMGSKATQDAQLMRTFMKELKRCDLFFLDSRSVRGSVAAEIAHTMGVPTAERAVFLDNEDNEAAIAKQLRTLSKMGDGAVGIGHLRPTTIKVLVAQMPQLEKEGIHWVSCSRVTK